MRQDETGSQLFEKLQKDSAGFQKLAGLLKELTGIHLPLNDKNLSLMASRLSVVLKNRGFSKYSAYYDKLVTGSNDMLTEFISSLTTNTTSFFRENKHFDVLKDAVARLVAKKGPGDELRVWCAASSTGQEPYTLAMTIEAVLEKTKRIPYSILATDVDREALETAYCATYSKADMVSVDAFHRVGFFDSLPGKLEFRVKEKLRKNVEFGEFNLTADNYPFKDRFDIVFCRNVLIYFDKATASAVVGKLTQSLVPGGYLFLGHSESGVTRVAGLQSMDAAVYKKVG